MRKTSSLSPSLLFESLAQTGLLKVLKLRQKAFGLKQPWRVGLCVSGGPDSMVLAHLLRHMVHPSNSRARIFSPCAFVVDHGVRDGSYQEALWVKSQLEASGIETHITKLEWPIELSPSAMAGFEKEARVRRYRALASMAEKNEISDLFTGHHLDDQVETLFLRLLRDRSFNPFSFQGMLNSSALPECENVPHVNSTTRILSAVNDRIRPPPGNKVQLEEFSTGIRLHRPLLPFSKSQLVATCETHKIQYVQDKTNFIPALTPRNAIRHLRTYFELPSALQSPNILRSLAKARLVHDNIERQAHKIRKDILELRMYGETGSLYLRFMPQTADTDENYLLGLSYFMCRIMALLSPLPSNKRVMMLDRGRTEEMLTRMLNTSLAATGSLKPIVFNKVTCQRLTHQFSDTSSSVLFSRQPMTAGERKSLTQRFEVENNVRDNPKDRKSSKHLLWDHRIWIQLAADEESAIKDTLIRAYEPSDAFKIRQMLQARGRLEEFERVMSQLAPGHVRYTLPVLVSDNEVVAFPTLDLSMIAEPLVSWQVRYSRDLRATQFFFPDIQYRDIRSWSLGRLTDTPFP